MFPPLNEKTEEKVILTFLGELIDVDLNLNPSLELGGETQATVTQPGRLIIVGASHMTSMVSHLPRQSRLSGIQGHSVGLGANCVEASGAGNQRR